MVDARVGGSVIVYVWECKLQLLVNLHHWKDRVLGFFPVFRIGTDHPLLTRRRVCPPLGSGVRGTLAAEGVGCGLSSNEGTALWTLGIYSMYFVTYIYHSRFKVGSTKTNNMAKLFLYLAFTHPCLHRCTIIIHTVHRDLFYILLNWCFLDVLGC